MMPRIHPLALVLSLTVAAAACASGDMTPTSPPETALQAAVAVPPPPPPAAVCLEFNVPALWTVYTAPGTPPGTMVFVENGISVTTRRFYDAALNPYYNGARIEPGQGWLGADPSARLNNISLQFGFGGLPFVPSQVTIDYHDKGGFENLTFNATPLRIGQLETLGGGGVAIAWWWAGFNKEGRVSIAGPVGTATIGGQELWIDTVCAWP
ncbi:MAG TPA: hypothetical protein VF006_30700 [Longimicrobium sp.]